MVTSESVMFKSDLLPMKLFKFSSFFPQSFLTNTSLWMGPYIVKWVLAKEAYDLVDYDGIPLVQTQNELYLKHYYAWLSVVTSLYAFVMFLFSSRVIVLVK